MCLGLRSVLTSHRGGGVEVLITGQYQQLSGQTQCVGSGEAQSLWSHRKLRVGWRLSGRSAGETRVNRELPDGHNLHSHFDERPFCICIHTMELNRLNTKHGLVP